MCYTPEEQAEWAAANSPWKAAEWLDYWAQWNQEEWQTWYMSQEQWWVVDSDVHADAADASMVNAPANAPEDASDDAEMVH